MLRFCQGVRKLELGEFIFRGIKSCSSFRLAYGLDDLLDQYEGALEAQIRSNLCTNSSELDFVDGEKSRQFQALCWSRVC